MNPSVMDWVVKVLEDGTESFRQGQELIYY